MAAHRSTRRWQIAGHPLITMNGKPWGPAVGLGTMYYHSFASLKQMRTYKTNITDTTGQFSFDAFQRTTGRILLAPSRAYSQKLASNASKIRMASSKMAGFVAPFQIAKKRASPLLWAILTARSGAAQISQFSRKQRWRQFSLRVVKQ